MNKWIGILGYPLTYSPSKEYHIQKLTQHNLKYDFKVLEWKPESFAENIEELKKDSSCLGFSVTMPYKERIISHLDDCEPFATQVRSVNCVKNNDGKWLGFNTDAPGFMAGINTWSPKPPKRVTCIFLGAGATARTLSMALANDGYRKFTFKNRTKHRAQTWAEQLKDCFKDIEVEVADFDAPITGKDLFFLNVIPGTAPELNLTAPAWVFDVSHSSTETALIGMCRKNCFYTINGLPMFYKQADLAFEIWFGLSSPSSDLIGGSTGGSI